MNSQSQTVLNAALALDETERAAIAERLLASLTSDAVEPSEDELAAELDRRLDEFSRDPSSAVPWSALRGED